MPCKYGITTTIFVKHFIAVGKKHHSPHTVGTVYVSTVYIDKYWQQKPDNIYPHNTILRVVKTFTKHTEQLAVDSDMERQN